MQEGMQHKAIPRQHQGHQPQAQDMCYPMHTIATQTTATQKTATPSPSAKPNQHSPTPTPSCQHPSTFSNRRRLPPALLPHQVTLAVAHIHAQAALAVDAVLQRSHRRRHLGALSACGRRRGAGRASSLAAMARTATQAAAGRGLPSCLMGHPSACRAAQQSRH